MKIYSILILFVFLFQISVAADDSQSSAVQRRNELHRIINLELQELDRLGKNVSQNPQMLLRMAELLLEKARLYKEAEHEVYINTPVSKRKQIKKSSFYKQSTKYYKRAQGLAFLIKKKFPRYQNMSDVYYIVAFNFMEFGQNKEAKKYFQASINKSGKNKFIKIKSMLALGNLYFNEFEYEKAIPQYEYALRSVKDKWWTKDAFNLAWCYYQVKKYEAAISLMKKVALVSEDKNMIDMKDEALRDLSIFYATSGKTNEALDYYQDQGKDVVVFLLKMGSMLIGQARFEEAHSILLKAKKEAENQNRMTELKDIRLELLKVYEKMSKSEAHLQTCKDLKAMNDKGLLQENDKKILIYHSQRMGATYQKKIADKIYRVRPAVQKKLGNMAIEYFLILESLIPQEKDKYFYYAGETSYALRDYRQALNYYSESYKFVENDPNKKVFAKKVLDSMSVTLTKIKGAKNDDLLEKTYLANLKVDGNNKKKSFKIYQRLFQLYMKQNRINDAEKIFVEFVKEFPDSFNIGEAMLANLLDHYKKKNDYQGMKKWYDQIIKGNVKVHKRYLNKLKLLMLTMQFKDVENSTSKGNKKEALKGYVLIYKDPQSTSEARKNSAYNIATLFYELGDGDRMYKWSSRALDHMDSKDAFRFETSFLAIGLDLFDRQEFEKAYEIFHTMLKKTCSFNSNNKDLFFNNSMAVSLAMTGENSKANNTLIQGRTCKVSPKAMKTAQFDYLNKLIEDGQFEKAYEVLLQLKDHNELWVDLIYPTYQILKGDDGVQNRYGKKLRGMITDFYNYCKQRNIEIPLNAIDVIALNMISKMIRISSDLEKLTLNFPENVFQQAIKSKFELLAKLTDEGLEIMKLGSGKALVRSHKILIISYQRVIDEINGFEPPGKPKEYVDSFKKEMKSIVGPLQSKVNEYYESARSKIEQYEILSDENTWFYKEYRSDIIFMRLSPGAIMDRGGVK